MPSARKTIESHWWDVGKRKLALCASAAVGYGESARIYPVRQGTEKVTR